MLFIHEVYEAEIWSECSTWHVANTGAWLFPESSPLRRCTIWTKYTKSHFFIFLNLRFSENEIVHRVKENRDIEMKISLRHNGKSLFAEPLGPKK